jgi:cysteinyl-tRNA synthetase
MITIDGQKMGKSYGNFITMEQLFAGEHPKLEQPYTPMTVRFFILQAHYRSTLDFSNAALQAAEKGLDRLMKGVETLAKLKINFDPVILALTISADMEGVTPSDYDVMALYSPSDVKSVIENFKVEELPVVATFGEATLRAALEAGMSVKASAPSPEAPSMAKALDLYISKVKRGEDVAIVEISNDEQKEEFIRTQQSKLAKKGRTRTTSTEKK